MEQVHKTVDTHLLLEAYRELLPQTEYLPLVITGNSMAPFLHHGKDTVYLSAIRRPLKTGDMVLYQRDNGAYILHRICRCADSSYSMVGDAQHTVEPGIRADQIFALVSRVERKGKILSPGCFVWDFFEKIWIRMIPLRPFFLRLGTLAIQLFRRKTT